MNKYKTIRVGLFGAILLFLMGCCRIERTGSPEASRNLATSQKNNLFICRYTPNKYVFKNGIDSGLQIENAWVEKLWTYDTKKCKDIVLVKSGVYQFVIQIHDIDKSDYRKYWVFRETESNQILHPNTSCLSYRKAQLDDNAFTFYITKYSTPLIERVKKAEIETGIIIDTVIFTKIKE